jgi:putative DNA primase/helicase
MSDKPRPDPTPPPVFARASDIAPMSVEWVWRGRVPRGKLTILAGDPGTGKTTVAFDLAARVSSGRNAPGDDGCVADAAAVLIVSAEDGAADTIRPRLDAAGADVARVHIFVRTEPLAIPGDVAMLATEIGRTGARLVVLDPLSALLAVKNAWSVTDVRRAIAPLASMAEATRAAVLAVEHLNKDATKAALYRVQGSIAFVAAARVSLVVGRDPDDEERRVLAINKCNLARQAPSLGYRVMERGAATCVEWLGVSPHTADEILAPPKRRKGRAVEDAEAYLGDVLANGAALAREVEARAKERGIADATLRRAKRSIAVRSERRGTEWWWHLLADVTPACKRALLLVTEPSPPARCDKVLFACSSPTEVLSCLPPAMRAPCSRSRCACGAPGGDA